MDEFLYDCFLFSDGGDGGSDGNRDKNAPYQKEQTADAAAADSTKSEGGKDKASSLSAAAAEKSKNKRSLGEANDDDDAKPAKRQQKQQQGGGQQQQESDTEYGDLDREDIDENLALFDNPNVFALDDHFACYPGTLARLLL